MALKPGQITCINTLDQPLVVAAGAGSGKTFTLTKRIVHALESGFVRDIDQVLAITFTKKAAGELKSRIKSSLAAAGMMDQALKVDEAWISTIHGMCARILRAHAVELDIDPKFKVGAAAVLGEYLSDAINQALIEAELNDPEQLDALFKAYPAQAQKRGASVEGMVRELVDRMSAAYEGAQAVRMCEEAVDATRCLAHVVDCADQLRALVEAQKESSRQASALSSLNDAVEDMRKALACAPVEPQRALALMGEVPASYGFGNAEFKSASKELVALMQHDAVRVRLLLSHEHLGAIVSLAQRSLELFSARKKQEGILDNNDLLVLASRAIAEHDDIAALYENKFSIIMVDEFQDTDQMQVDMIKRLAGDGARRLCTVGDAQQSIYRFRGADVSVYRRHLNDVAHDDPAHVIKLPDNFRSHADVLSFVDRIFERSEMFGGEFMSLACSRDENRVARPFKGAGGRIVVQHTSYAKRGGMRMLREVAAKRIARTFAAYAQAGHAASDMVVLLGTMSNAALYAQAIRDEGLACVIAGGSVLGASKEAEMVLALVRVLANPRQTQDLFTVLSSPLFALSASDFVELATGLDEQEGRLRKRGIDVGLREVARDCANGGAAAFSPQLASAALVLQGALGAVGRASVSSLVRRIVLESGLVARLESEGGEGQAFAANVYKLVRMLDELERADFLGPAALAERFRHTLEVSTESPGALSATGGNFVRIMTVHASKGLEFPIVAIAEMKDDRAGGSRLLADSIDGSVFLSLETPVADADLAGIAAAPSSAIDDLVDADLDEDDLAALVQKADDPLLMRAYLRARAERGDHEEAKRLLYVALTRAKEAIVVSTLGSASKNNPHGAPGNVFGSIGLALTGSDEWFEPGVSHFEFGGSLPAVVEHVRVEEDGSVIGLDVDDAAALLGGQGSAHADGPARFMVPSHELSQARPDAVFKPLARDVFSYSSVSESSHEGDLLETLARDYWVECIGAPDEGDEALDVRDDGFDPLWRSGSARGSALVADEDEASWAYLDNEAADADKATDMGTAFHRLAEYAVHVKRADEVALKLPPEERVRALSRTCRLSQMQDARLKEALNRWFACDVAAEMARCKSLRAEVPFFVKVQGAQKDAPTASGDGRIPGDACALASAHLEGEIDLLAYRDDRSAAVVDYKTGGKPSESCSQLRVKHVLQACCYAFALLRQGCPHVDVTFVRVEQPDVNNPDAPQLVRYAFDSSCLPRLEEGIFSAYLLARGQRACS